ncbi:hypothetical protein CEXT_459431 [Caerostris extrusa]|uniref:Uncharacterized protein n=1 Tax=Caerostris extrusa TaxID=172846 RepID=A0AAV4TYV8_CAEEX|nr:hypothetical protein CEXT_459431 [Caerostris extrusa]
MQSLSVSLPRRKEERSRRICSGIGTQLLLRTKEVPPTMAGEKEMRLYRKGGIFNSSSALIVTKEGLNGSSGFKFPLYGSSS